MIAHVNDTLMTTTINVLFLVVLPSNFVNELERPTLQHTLLCHNYSKNTNIGQHSDQRLSLSCFLKCGNWRDHMLQPHNFLNSKLQNKNDFVCEVPLTRATLSFLVRVTITLKWIQMKMSSIMVTIDQQKFLCIQTSSWLALFVWPTAGSAVKCFASQQHS